VNVEKFWRIVAGARHAAGNDSGGRVEALRARLLGLGSDDLQQFQNIYDEHIRRSNRRDLWVPPT
jgi:Protein of unknown function (DUF4240)